LVRWFSTQAASAIPPQISVKIGMNDVIVAPAHEFAIAVSDDNATARAAQRAVRLGEPFRIAIRDVNGRTQPGRLERP
jgi:hypothetical protein